MSTTMNECQTSPRGVVPRILHRIASVRRREGVSLRGIARKLRVDVRLLRQQEEETNDLRLSDIYLWQRVLQVPLADLLVDQEEPLSAPVMRRAQLVKVMKTATSIFENADDPRLQRMAQHLIEQLCEIMPELEGVSPWPSVGQRRTLDEYGRAADHHVSGNLARRLETA